MQPNQSFSARLSYFWIVLCGFMTPLCACSSNDSIDTTTISSLDLNRYLGTWYELARFDHRFERDMNNCTAHYSLREDGKIRVLNRGWKNGSQTTSEGKAKTTGTPGLLRVSFFGPFYSDYRILMLDSDYRFALIGSATNKYLWILSRTPELPEATIQLILQEAQRRGYDTNSLIWVDQSVNINMISSRSYDKPVE